MLLVEVLECLVEVLFLLVFSTLIINILPKFKKLVFSDLVSKNASESS